jgi:PAS domain S-box-containing protein
MSAPLNILVVEDDPDSCENLRDILELEEHLVHIAHTGQQALSHPELAEVSLILLDWKLPDTTALEILSRLRSAAPQADIMIVTGHGDLNHAVEALREGAIDYLLKPINPEVLRKSIQRLTRERNLTEEKARSEEMFRNLVQAAPCLIVILERDLTIRYCSPFAQRLTGYNASEVQGRNFAELFLPEAQRAVAEAVANDVIARGSIEGRRTEIRCRDGSARWIMWNAQQLMNRVDGGQILAVGQDITDHLRATEKLIQSERLAAIGEAMTGLAHESRNALQRSQAFLDLLMADVASMPTTLKLVGRIQESQAYLHRLYEEVRQFAAPIRIDASNCSIPNLLQETWESLDIARTHRQAIFRLGDCERAPLARTDRFLLQQVFRNIFENSLAACPDPVEIWANCEEITSHGRSHLRVSIRDNGPGLSAEQREHLFDAFFTTKTRGTGLGLTICKRIVEAHGGTLSVGSGPGAELVLTIEVSDESPN